MALLFQVGRVLRGGPPNSPKSPGFPTEFCFVRGGVLAIWVNFWRVQKLRLFWVILRLWFIHMGMPSMGIYPWSPQHPERFINIPNMIHHPFRFKEWLLDVMERVKFVFFAWWINYMIYRPDETSGFYGFRSDLDFENLFLKHRFTSPFAFDDLPPKMWQNSHGNWRVHPQCHPFSRKEGIFWGIIQIFKDGTLKITIIFRYWWIWLGIQGLFGCLSTLLATDFRENDWPFDLYLLTDT